MMGNQGLLEAKERRVDPVLQVHLVPEASLVSWASLVPKETMVLLEKMENEVALEVLALRVLLERMVRPDLRVLQDLLALLVTKETQDPLVHKDYKACLERVVLQEKTENLVNLVQRVRLVHLEFQEARVILVLPVNADLLEQEGPLDLEVELAPLVPKEERVLLVPLGHLVLLVHLVCKECLEKEGVLEALVQRVIRVSLAAQVSMVLQGKMVHGVPLVPLVLLAQLVSLEIRVKVVPLEFRV